MDDRLLRHLAEFSSTGSAEEFPARARIFARHCLLDFMGVALAGAGEPVVAALRDFCIRQQGAAEASVFGHGARLPLRAAALVAGAAAHALDFDDNNLVMQGHPSAPLLGAILPLAEHLDTPGSELIDAFITGYEVECRIGAGFGLDHYDAGFHATATLGTLGAAAASARLLKLSPGDTASALALAASQASGLKVMFGTMGKVAQVGMAAEKGLVAALLVSHGIATPVDALMGQSGFVRTHGASFAAEAAFVRRGDRLEVEQTIFKYHASCLDTHPVIEAIHAIMRDHGLRASDIDRIDIRAYEEIDSVCNIPAPDTGLGMKFSLRAIAALAVLGIPTGEPATFTDGMARDPRVVAFRDRTTVHLCGDFPRSCAEVSLALKDGRTLKRAHDSTIVASDLDDQERRLVAKFRSLVDPLLGSARAGRLAGLILGIERHSAGDLAASAFAAPCPQAAQ